VGCRQEGYKHELLRICRDAAGSVRVDLTGKAPGRGAYLHQDAVCIALARRRKALERALSGPVEASIWNVIMPSSDR
jgi:predicted RNA-binding protein YlxR (DUF448 family)